MATPRLQAGDRAPIFEVYDVSGQLRSLKDYEGRRTMVSFYRFISCPLCNLRIHQLTERWPEFSSEGLYNLSFFQSSCDNLRQAADRREMPFPLISDPERETYAKYSIESSFKKTLAGQFSGSMVKALSMGFRPGIEPGDQQQVPADFIIGPNLVIERAYYGNTIADHMPLDEIAQHLSGAPLRRAA